MVGLLSSILVKMNLRGVGFTVWKRYKATTGLQKVMTSLFRSRKLYHRMDQIHKIITTVYALYFCHKVIICLSCVVIGLRWYKIQLMLHTLLNKKNNNKKLKLTACIKLYRHYIIHFELKIVQTKTIACITLSQYHKIIFD